MPIFDDGLAEAVRWMTTLNASASHAMLACRSARRYRYAPVSACSDMPAPWRPLPACISRSKRTPCTVHGARVRAHSTRRRSRWDASQCANACRSLRTLPPNVGDAVRIGLSDAQTSGGLYRLIAVAPEGVERPDARPARGRLHHARPSSAKFARARGISVVPIS